MVTKTVVMAVTKMASPDLVKHSLGPKSCLFENHCSWIKGFLGEKVGFGLLLGSGRNWTWRKLPVV